MLVKFKSSGINHVHPVIVLKPRKIDLEFMLNYKDFYCTYSYSELFYYTPCLTANEYECVTTWEKVIREKYGKSKER